MLCLFSLSQSWMSLFTLYLFQIVGNTSWLIYDTIVIAIGRLFSCYCFLISLCQCHPAMINIRFSFSLFLSFEIFSSWTFNSAPVSLLTKTKPVYLWIVWSAKSVELFEIPKVFLLWIDSLKLKRFAFEVL